MGRNSQSAFRRHPKPCPSPKATSAAHVAGLLFSKCRINKTTISHVAKWTLPLPQVSSPPLFFLFEREIFHTLSHIFGWAHVFLVIHYISQIPLQLEVTMWLSACQWHGCQSAESNFQIIYLETLALDSHCPFPPMGKKSDKHPGNILGLRDGSYVGWKCSPAWMTLWNKAAPDSPAYFWRATWERKKLPI